ncbi:hypothetical protein T01_7085 [Trichinella spiralis]|uniref:Uncharacterized protein n=1 Tax=Trichinella spiralis TaxID=6334 RepID=A0A0V1AVN5_TRISP|nr:hypothetical protein T01_7085 [Trichinella spiralis]
MKRCIFEKKKKIAAASSMLGAGVANDAISSVNIMRAIKKNKKTINKWAVDGALLPSRNHCLSLFDKTHSELTNRSESGNKQRSQL